LTSSVEAIVGLIANPASGHDMRRLISGASVFTNTEKVHVVRRLFSGLGAVGVARVLVMPDRAGLSLGISRAAEQHRPHLTGPWPEIELLDFEPHNAAVDSVIAAQEMVARGVGALVALGGDGTARAVASACADTPMLALSTGTNNAFGVSVDGTVAGLAAALVATGACALAEASYRAKKLIVRHGERTEIALVDMAIIDQDRVGARAVWDPDLVRELAVTFAEPHAVGLSAIAGAISPCGRREPSGRLLRMGDGHTVLAALAPGLMRLVTVAENAALLPGRPVELSTSHGVIALDGEREMVFHADGPRPTVELSLDGPLVIDVEATMALAAQLSLLVR
jgi:predicted polyphosphate/ATP-dependent NAD kinase